MADTWKVLAPSDSLLDLKCIWSEKWFLLIWNAFQNTEECRFSFWNIFFRFRDINIFLLCKLDQWWRHNYCLQLKIVKCWINNISRYIKAVFLKLCTTIVHHKRNKMTPLVLFFHFICTLRQIKFKDISTLSVCFLNIYLLDSDLSGEERCPAF